MEKVYFTKNIDEKSLVKMYEVLGKKLEGKVAVKVTTGELGGHNYLKPELIKDLVKKLNGTIVECNTAYPGSRNYYEDHMDTAKKHGFLDYFDVDIMDKDGEKALDVTDGKHLKRNYVGKNLENYDSILVLSHFKGHQMAGFGGALKNMSIGIASRNGKALIHSAGKTNDPDVVWSNLPEQTDFLESMAEADKSVMDYMNNKIVYINVLNNISIDCDCDSNPEEPCMKDIGILSSLDPVALDRASYDMVCNSSDEGKTRLLERIEKQKGPHVLDYAEKIGLGSQEYELVDIDN